MGNKQSRLLRDYTSLALALPFIDPQARGQFCPRVKRGLLLLAANSLQAPPALSRGR
jgi:hypothetical protein